jgi:predicted enzyme related to lactoylglutathione lyase
MVDKTSHRERTDETQIFPCRYKLYRGLSIDECVSKIEQSGGKVAVAKTEIQNMGFLQCFQDSENNLFGLYEGQRK